MRKSLTLIIGSSCPVRISHHVRMCRYLSYDVGRHPFQYHLLPWRTGEHFVSFHCKYIQIQKTDICNVFQPRLDPGKRQILSDGNGHCSQLSRLLLCAGSTRFTEAAHSERTEE